MPSVREWAPEHPAPAAGIFVPGTFRIFGADGQHPVVASLSSLGEEAAQQRFVVLERRRPVLIIERRHVVLPHELLGDVVVLVSP